MRKMKGGKKMRKQILFNMLIILIIGNTSGFVSGEMLISETGVEYDAMIPKVFKNQTYAKEMLNQTNFTILEIKNDKVWLRVIIRLQDNSEIKILGTKEERIELMKQRDEWFKSKIEEVLVTLSREEFELRGKLSDGFSGSISEVGFNKLIGNEDIKKIIWPRTRPNITLDESAPLINATYVWDNLNYTGNGTKVCVIDTGVDKYHPDLSGKIVGEYCYCINNCCPNGGPSDNNATDKEGHGTHVVGTIASQNLTYEGIAYNADIYVVRVADSNGEMTSDWDDIGRAIDWCRINKSVDIISMSLGDGGNYPGSEPCKDYIDTEINNAYNSEIALVIASGNDGYTTGINYPACSENATSVGATYDDNLGLWKSIWYEILYGCWNIAHEDEITCFTSRGTNLDLLAPGADITSTKMGGGFKTDAGTSMAAPHIAGAVALMLEKNSSLTPDEIRQILKDTGKPIWDPGTQRTYPRINVMDAVGNVTYCNTTKWVPHDCGGLNKNCSATGDRYRTRTVDPSGCAKESECKYDPNCTYTIEGGGDSLELTVCASGCNYTSIQTAIDNSDVNDKIIVTDNRTYAEEIVMNSTTSGWLNCQAGANISKSAPKGIFLNNVEVPLVVGCIINGFDIGIYVNSSYALIQNNTLTNNENAIYFRKQVVNNKIKYNNITGSSLYGLHFYATTWADSANSNKVEYNIIRDNGEKGIYIRKGISNSITGNNISKSDSANEYGIHLEANNENSACTIQNNLIYENYKGVYLHKSDYNTVSNNLFCPSNTNVDVDDSGTGNEGDNNRCEKPGSWNDDGTTGCTYYCDDPADVTLLYPPNNFLDLDGNVDLVCKSTDNSQLVNVTLYHNISGTWHANETRNISGTSNITVFDISGLGNTTFIWNCFAYDNRSRGNFASANWTVNVTIINQPPSTPTSLSCNNQSCTNNNTFQDNIQINCSGSSDDENNNITYFIESYYNHTSILETNSFNNSLTTENLTFSGNENITRYLSINKHANIAGAYLNLTGRNAQKSDWQENLNTNIKAYWKLNETSGTNALDSVNALFNGTSSGANIGQTGLIGKAYTLDTTDHVTLDNNMYNGNNLTIAIWVKANEWNNNNDIWHYLDSTDSDPELQLEYKDSTSGIYAVATGNGVNSIASNITPDTDVWTLIVYQITNDGTGNFTLWINDTIVGSDSSIDITATAANHHRLGDGDPSWSAGDAFNGTIDEVGFWNRYLTPQEISDLYNNGAGITYDPLKKEYTDNPFIEINQTNIWNYSGEFNESFSPNKTSDFKDVLNTVLNSGACDCEGCSLDGDDCIISFLFHSDSEGILEYSVLNITYEINENYFWETIGNHSESSTLNWNISELSEQSGVDLKCRAIDLEGSNIYSDYYDPGINITIDTTPSITISSPTNTSYSNPNILFNVSTNEEGVGMIVGNLDDSLISWWRMDDVSESGDPLDYLGNNNGSKQGNANQISGKFGKAFEFDGVGDYISFSSDQSLNFSAQNLSVFAWVYHKNVSTDYGRIIRGSNAAGSFYLKVNNGGSVQALIFNMAGSSSGWVTSTTNIPENTWSFVGFTYNETIGVYVNGVLEKTKNHAGGIRDRSNRVEIGGTDYYFNGSIDELMIFNRSLTASEIVSLYNATKLEFTETLESGHHTFKAYAQDTSGNINESELIEFSVASPEINLSVLYPTENINVTRNQFFNVTVNLSCVKGNCGTVNVSLDPIGEGELINERTYNQKVYSLENGQERYEIHTGHIHYKEGSDFEEINTSLVAGGNGWVMDKASYSLEIPEYSDGEFKFVNEFEGANDAVVMKPVGENVEGVMSGNEVVYEGVFGSGIDLIVIAKNDGFDKLIVINEKPENLTEDLEFSFEINLTGFVVNSSGDGIEFVGTGVTYMREFRIWDSDRNAMRVNVRLEEQEGKYYFIKTLDKEFLETADYPVKTDDTLTYYSGGGDGYVYNSDSSWDACHDADSGVEAYPTFEVGYTYVYSSPSYYQIHRSFLPINTSGIADNAVINNASLYLYGYQKYNDFDASAHVVQTTQFDVSTLSSSDFSEIGDTSGGSIDISDFTIGDWNVIELDSTGQSWINKSGWTKLGLRDYYDLIDSDPGSGESDIEWYFSEGDNSSYLEIDVSVNPKGLIPVGSGVPFYTNESNPRGVSLGFEESEVVVYWVNATSETGYTYDFFAFGNLTSDMSNSVVSEWWEVGVV